MVIILILGLVGGACIDGSDDGITGEITADPCQAVPIGRVLLPEDDYPHDDPIEWYYWTGHLQTDEGRWFGYELVFFLVGATDRRVQLVHHAVTDIDDQTYHYVQQAAYSGLPQMDEPMRLAAGPFRVSLENGSDTLRGEVDHYILDLELASIKAPVLHHGDGYTDYDFGGYTYYYSRERMQTEGNITVGQETYHVTGVSWFDHQWGGLTQVVDIGWDWFAIQLDDSREIMLAIVHDDGEILMSAGSLTTADCETVPLESGDFSVDALGYWTSPHTSKTYPMGWDIRLQGINISVLPLLDDQEFVSGYKTYWEGACEVSGQMTGRAYVEMTGY